MAFREGVGGIPPYTHCFRAIFDVYLMVYYLHTTSYCLRVYGLILLGFGHDSARILCCGRCLIMFNNRVCAKSFEHGAHLRELCSAFCERHRNTLSPRLARVACGFDAV